MKITISLATQVISNVLDNKFIQNQVGTAYLYVYGITEGYLVKATFQRDDGKLIGPYQGMYDTDPDDEYCYIISIPSAATEVAKGLGISMAIYEPQGTDPETYKIYTTVRTAAYVYQNDSIVAPETIESQTLDAINLAISNLAAAKIEYSAIVGATGETINKDTPIYSKQKSDELLAANSVTDKGYTDAEVAKIKNGTYVSDKATKDALGNVITTTYETKSDANAHKNNTSNPHGVTKEQIGVGNVDNTSDENKPVSTAQQAALDGHNTSEVSHSFIRGLIQELEREIERLDNRGKSLGEVNYTTAQLQAMDSATLAATIKSAIEAETWFEGDYTPVSGDLIYDTGVGAGVNYHEWEYNGSAWVDNGAINSPKATNDIFGTIKGNSYLSIVAGLVQVVLSDNATYLKDAGSASKYTYQQIFDAIANRYTKAEVNALLDSLKLIQGVTETALDQMVDEDTALVSAIDAYDLVILEMYDGTNDKLDSQIVSPSDLVSGDVIEFRNTDSGALAFATLTKDATNYTLATAAGNVLRLKGISFVDTLASNIVTSYADTNFIDGKVNQDEVNRALDTQVKVNADDIAVIESKEYTAEFDTDTLKIQSTAIKNALFAAQPFSNSEFETNVTGWSFHSAQNNATLTWENGKAKVYLITSGIDFLYRSIKPTTQSFVSGHKYLIKTKVQANHLNANKFEIKAASIGLTTLASQAITEIDTDYELGVIVTHSTLFPPTYVLEFHLDGVSMIATFFVDYFRAHDLTDIFGAGNEPADVATANSLLANIEAGIIDTAVLLYKDKTLSQEISRIENMINSLDYKEYGVREIVGQSSPTLERVSRFGGELKIGSATGLVAAVGVDDEVVYNSFDYIPIFQRSRETHLDGNVFVRVPKYYIKEEWKSESGTNYHYIWMCQSKLAGYRTPLSFTNEDGTENDSYFIGAYEGSISFDSKLKSVTNAIQKVSYSRANFRTAARLNDGLGTASKYQITDVAEYVDLVQIPMMIEFATKNMQSILQGFTAGQYTTTHLPLVAETAVNRVILTNAQAALYRVGQMIDIGTSQGGRQVAQDRQIVSITVDTPEAGQSEIIFDGAAITTTLTQMVYNVANKTGECDTVVASSGAKTANDGKYSCIWRGMENPYGNTYKNIDGVKISNNQTWICLLPSLYNDTASVAGDYVSPFVKLSYININANGYCAALGYDPLYPFAKFPTSITGGSSVLYFSDYYYQNTGDRTAFVGGDWVYGSVAGPFCWSLNHSLGYTSLDFGARLSKRP